LPRLPHGLSELTQLGHQHSTRQPALCVMRRAATWSKPSAPRSRACHCASSTLPPIAAELDTVAAPPRGYMAIIVGARIQAAVPTPATSEQTRAIEARWGRLAPSTAMCVRPPSRTYGGWSSVVPVHASSSSGAARSVRFGWVARGGERRCRGGGGAAGDTPCLVVVRADRTERQLAHHSVTHWPGGRLD
jgi:hypothetical protein